MDAPAQKRKVLISCCVCSGFLMVCMHPVPQNFRASLFSSRPPGHQPQVFSCPLGTSFHILHYSVFPLNIHPRRYNNNIAAEPRRVALTSIGVPLANAMGLVSSNIFFPSSAPSYKPALITTACFGEFLSFDTWFSNVAYGSAHTRCRGDLFVTRLGGVSVAFGRYSKLGF